MTLRIRRNRCITILAIATGTLAAAATTAPVKHPSSTPVLAGSSLLRGLSLRDRIAQMIMIRGYGDYPPSDNAEYKQFLHCIRDLHVGGFIVAGRILDGNVQPAQPFEMAVFINHVQRLARTPLLVAADFERGASMRVAETAKFPYMMAFGAAHDLQADRELGAATAREARALGVTWVFAPDSDVNNNPDNPIINVRSFGQDPQAVAAGVAAFIQGAHSDRKHYVLVTAKHFPGHGDTSQDTHMQVALLDQPRERLERLELVPFRAAIDHGVDAVMTAHMAVPAFDPERVPATVSRNILTGLLRDELGFKGLVVTDALEMQAIAGLYSQGEAAVRTVEAGTDVLLMPTDPEACIRAIAAAVKAGKISRQRIDASAAKILAAKQRAGLLRSRVVSLDTITDSLAEKKFEDLAQQTADHAFTLVKDDKHLFPFASPDGACLVVMNESDFSRHGDVIARTMRAKNPNLKTYIVSSQSPPELLADVAKDVSQCKQIYAIAFVTVSANRGSVALLGGLDTFLKSLTQQSAPVALVSMGNPYLLRDYPAVAAYAATFSTAITSELAAAHAILGEIPIDGKLPISIPGVAAIGEGLNVPAHNQVASTSSK